MYKFPSVKGFRRRTRLERAGADLERMNALIISVMNVFSVYGDPKNWMPTDESKDVRNEAGLVVGVERLHTWNGPGCGPELAVQAMKRILGEPMGQQMKTEAK